MCVCVCACVCVCVILLIANLYQILNAIYIYMRTRNKFSMLQKYDNTYNRFK